MSAGVTAWQISLMQALGWVGWYHFAYLVIALALLGFGASGTLITLARERLVARHDSVVRAAAGLASAGMALAPLLAGGATFATDLYLLFSDPAHVMRILVACAALGIPFFLCGLAIGLALTRGATNAGRLYAWNLAGSGAGGLIGWLVLAAVVPARASAIVAVLPLAGALLLRPARGDGAVMRIAPALLAAASIAATLLLPGGLHPSQFKDISRLLDLPESQVVIDDPDPHGWLQVVESPVFRPAPPVSLRFTGGFPVQRAVLVDGNLRGSLIVDDGDGALEMLDHSLEAVAWATGTRDRVMLIEAGGGGIAGWARWKGASTVVCVEPHPGIARELARVLPAGAIVENREPRDALSAHGDDFDVIRFPMAGSFGGSAGVQAVGEQFLFTAEAFAAAIPRLSDDGMIIASAWAEQPERNAPRLLATMIEGLRLAGVEDPRAHVAAVRSWNATTILAKRSPVGAKDIAAIEAFCGRLEFDPLVVRGEVVEAGDRFHETPGSALVEQVRAILGGDIPAAEAAVGGVFRLKPAVDDRPYFSQFLRIAKLGRLAESVGWRTTPFMEMGYLVVVLSVPLLLAAALALIVAPLAHVGWTGGSRWATALFCTGLGLGFMFIEIGLIARLTLFLGGPLSSAATVLTTLLVAAGAGSALSQRFQPGRRPLVRITLAVAAVSVLIAVSTDITQPGWEPPRAVRMLVAVALLAPAGFVMGMAFPTLLRLLGASDPSHVPWAWAVNGCASVVSPALATIMAVTAGHTAVFLAAAASYAVAAVMVRGIHEPAADGK